MILSKVHEPDLISSVNIIYEVGFLKCYSDHSIIHIIFSGILILIIYFDDILLTGSDVACIIKAKEYLKTRFVIKEMGKSRYFLGIEIA